MLASGSVIGGRFRVVRNAAPLTNGIAIVEDLTAKGVVFEHYDDLPETTREGDVHVMGDMRAVWFKDPDGNILSLVDREM